MLPQSEREIFQRSEQRGRFDADSARRVLERAVAEQYRLHKELDDTYSIEELEEMAAEAGISQQALRAAIQSTSDQIGISRRWVPKNWFKTNKGMVLAGVAALVVTGLMIAFPILAYIVFWVTIVLGVLILLGASPF